MIDIINNEENFVNIPLRDFESRPLDNMKIQIDQFGILYRSSRSEVFFEKGALKNLQISQKDT